MFWMFWFRQYFGWVLGLGVRFYDPFMVFKTVGSSCVLTSDPSLNHEVGSGQGWKILVSWSMLSEEEGLEIAHQWTSNHSQPVQPWDCLHKAKDRSPKFGHQTAHIRCWLFMNVDPFSCPIFLTNLWTETARMSSDKEIWKVRSLLAAWGCSLEQSSDVGHWYLSLLIHKCTHPNITNNFTNLRHQFR